MWLVRGQHEVVPIGTVQIDNLVAADTDQMVVTMSLGVVSRGSARVMNSPDQLQLDQRIEYPIDRPSGDLRASIADGVVDFVGSRMVVTLEQHLQHGPPLVCHGQSTLPAHFLESFQFFDSVRSHYLASRQAHGGEDSPRPAARTSHFTF